MNVLILTPDRVGSTLLQRLITVYMNAHDYNRPVINLHELTNGIVRYWSDVYQQEVLGKPQRNVDWSYHQSLSEVTNLLATTSHYKTSRLAHYHILNRRDTIAQQVPFYNYLNDNFFIISARRENLFEHALSWCIQIESKNLNVYQHSKKVEVFQDLYRNRIRINPEFMINYIFKYQAYLKWVDDHFRVNANFYYEKDLSRIEEYILGLNLFRGQTKKSWSDIFGIEFADWNRCHYLLSDLSGISGQLPTPHQQLQLTSSDQLREVKLHSIAVDKIETGLSLADQQYLLEHSKNYRRAWEAINELVTNGALVTGIPIKLQTLLEKRLLIENFDECLAVYNQWMLDKHSKIFGISDTISDQDLESQCQQEIQSWHAGSQLSHNPVNQVISSDNVVMKSISS